MTFLVSINERDKRGEVGRPTLGERHGLSHRGVAPFIVFLLFFIDNCFPLGLLSLA